MDPIPFIVAISLPNEPNAAKGFLDVTEVQATLRDIPVDKLRENLHRVSTALMQVLADIKSIGEFELAGEQRLRGPKAAVPSLA